MQPPFRRKFNPGFLIDHFTKDINETAIKRVRVAFEFMDKLGVPYYCLHDRDVAKRLEIAVRTSNTTHA